MNIKKRVKLLKSKFITKVIKPCNYKIDNKTIKSCIQQLSGKISRHLPSPGRKLAGQPQARRQLQKESF